MGASRPILGAGARRAELPPQSRVVRADDRGVPMPTAPRFRVDPGAGRSAGAGVRLPVLLLILGILVSAVAVWAPAADQRSSSERNYDLNRGAQQMLTAMLDQETGLRGYVLTADRRFLEPYRAGRTDVAAAERSILAEAAGDAALTDAIAESAQIAASWQQEAQETVDRVADRGGRGTAAALRRKAIMDRFRAANARVQAIVDARRRRALGRSEILPVASILLLAVAGIGIGWALVVRPRRRVAAEQRLARRYASEQQEFTEALQMTRQRGRGQRAPRAPPRALAARRRRHRVAPQQLRQPARADRPTAS